MTQEELADRVGVARPAVVQYESYAKEPSSKVLAGMASTLGVSMDDLMESVE